MAQSAKGGFTLIELSIVIVIIGLIAAGILVGQDMIRAAEIRATIAQIEKYNSAVNTFRGKYNGIPGDLQYQQASALGFFTLTNCIDGPAGTEGCGDGNGVLECLDDAFLGEGGACGEDLVFWRHLSDASLVDGNFSPDPDLNVGGAINVKGLLPSDYVPPAKLGLGNYVIAYGDVNSGENYYQIQGIKPNLKAIGYNYTLLNNMTPIDVQNIDTKLDDGLPFTGAVQATIGGNPPNTQPTAQEGNVCGSAITNCICGTAAPYTYDVTMSGNTASGTVPNCGVRLRFN